MSVLFSWTYGHTVVLGVKVDMSDERSFWICVNLE